MKDEKGVKMPMDVGYLKNYGSHKALPNIDQY